MADKDSVIMYKKLSETLDGLGFKYESDDMRLKATTTVNCGGQPLTMSVQIDDNKKLVFCHAELNIEVTEELRKSFVQGVCMVNMRLKDGSFDMSPKSGKCVFRMTSNFRDSIVGRELLEYVILVASKIIDVYIGKLLMLADGKMTLEEFKTALK